MATPPPSSPTTDAIVQWLFVYGSDTMDMADILSCPEHETANRLARLRDLAYEQDALTRRGAGPMDAASGKSTVVVAFKE